MSRFVGPVSGARPRSTRGTNSSHGFVGRRSNRLTAASNGQLARRCGFAFIVGFICIVFFRFGGKKMDLEKKARMAEWLALEKFYDVIKL
ncbi:hypothetical protein CEXT_734661 [Caerostris extrusa]|uniref:Transmembrane protein n=1 Tax=Caerostris extrusa TaxID=172846 RepID=A0AAV4U2H7_CAEEX|nr:hypothetical protein CEXT_734661 [Caerostris extrusa]